MDAVTSLINETLALLQELRDSGQRYVYTDTPSPPPLIKPVKKERAWDLDPPPPIPQNQDLFGAIIVGYFNENATHRTFLEKVAGALTDHVAPARLERIEGHPPPCMLLIAPIEGHEAHKLTKINGLKVLPMLPIDCYLDDVSQKRALWNALKQLPKSFSTAPLANP